MNQKIVDLLDRHNSIDLQTKDKFGKGYLKLITYQDVAKAFEVYFKETPFSEGYSIVDMESGVKYPCSKEYFESYQRIIKAVMPKLGPLQGVPMIFGTTGEMDNNAFQKLWNGLQTFEIIDDTEDIKEVPSEQ